eukprot:scaffold3111_cov332-Prasinococcus_capsulatus_cf.AAC.13
MSAFCCRRNAQLGPPSAADPRDEGACLPELSIGLAALPGPGRWPRQLRTSLAGGLTNDARSSSILKLVVIHVRPPPGIPPRPRTRAADPRRRR